MLLKLSKNSQENTCDRVSLLESLACNFIIKKETLVQMFPCDLCEIFKNTFFTEHLQEKDYICQKWYLYFRNFMNIQNNCIKRTFCRKVLHTLVWRALKPDSTTAGISVRTWWQMSLELVAQRCTIKKTFLKISENSQKNFCLGVSFLIKLHVSSLQLH